MRISQITAVKGRLDHVRRNIGRWMEASVDELIVVCFSCPDGTADWLRSPACPFYGDPRLVVVDVPPEEAGDQFCVAKARNMGAVVARGDLLLFLDADAYISPDAIEHVRYTHEHQGRGIQMWVAGYYCFDDEYPCDADICPPPTLAVDGQFMVRNHVFHALNGFNDSYGGWGGETYDFFARAAELDVLARPFPARSIYVQSHADTLRDRYLRPRFQFSGGQQTKTQAFTKAIAWFRNRRLNQRANPGRRMTFISTVCQKTNVWNGTKVRNFSEAAIA